MTLLALLIVGSLAAAGSAWALPRGGTAARIGAVGGVIALALVGILAALSPTPSAAAADASGVAPGMLWNGAIAAGGYLRLVVVLGATSAVLLSGLTWLLRGTPALRAILPASLAALVGTTVALGATDPQLGILAAGATGLASIPVVLGTPGGAAPGVAAREVRIAVATALVVLAVAAIIPALARVVLANPASAVSASGSGAAAAVAFALLAMAIVIGARLGAIPYHVRISALADTAPEGSLPLVVAWLPLPLAAVAVGVVASELAPLALPVGSAQVLIVALALLVTVAGGLVAAVQDDLRHAVGYLALADLGLVVLAFAALDPVAWGPARTWLLTAAVTKTALFAWAAVSEDRFETRSVPDLRGWLRPSPMLGVALVLIVVATYGLPGWAVLRARLDLTGFAATAPWDMLLLVASLLTLPAYVRWLWLGVGTPTSHVDRATPEFLAQRASSGPARRLTLRPPGLPRRRNKGLVVEQEGASPATPGSTTARAPAWPDIPAAGSAPARARRSAPPRADTRDRPSRDDELVWSGAEDDDAADDPGARRRDAVPSRFGLRLKPSAATRDGRASGLATAPALTPESAPLVESTILDTGEAIAIAVGPEAAAQATAPDAGPDTPPKGSPASSPSGRSKPAASKGATRGSAARSKRAPDAGSVTVGTDPDEPSALWDAPVSAAIPEAADQATLFAIEPGATLADDGAAPKPELANIRPGTGIGRRSRTGNGRSGSTPMSAPRAPEASKALPLAELATEDEMRSRDGVVRTRRGGAPTPDAGTRVAAAARRHRADLLSTLVLALALLATLVAFGAFDVSRAACEPTPAVPSVSCT